MMLSGRDDDPDRSYIQELTGAGIPIVAISQCPEASFDRKRHTFIGAVTFRLRPLRWVAVDTVELPSIATRPDDSCNDIRNHRYVWDNSQWRARPFIFMGEQCPSSQPIREVLQ